MCADSTTVSLGEWSPPCRMCGQLQLVLPDLASPTLKTPIGTVCFDCYTDYVSEQLRTQRLWDAQYIVLRTAMLAGLPRATQAKVAQILADGLIR